MNFKKWVKSVQTVSYYGALTVVSFNFFNIRWKHSYKLFLSILTGKFETTDANGKLCGVFLIHSVLLKQMPTYGHFIPYGHFPIQYILYGHFIPYGHFSLWTLFHMDILPYGKFADSPPE